MMDVFRHLAEILDNSFLQGLTYGVPVLGVSLALRVLRYPDLTADGSFLLGAAIFGLTLSSGKHWSIALIFSAFSGIFSGALTAALHYLFRVNRLLTGILTTMMLYSVTFRVMRGRSNISLSRWQTIFDQAENLDNHALHSTLLVHPASITLSLLIALSAIGVSSLLLRSDIGLLLRSTGGNPRLTEALGWSTAMLTTIGLCISNSLVAIGGALVSSRQGFADVNMGTGVVVLLIAALVVGEELGRFLGVNASGGAIQRSLVAFLGSVLYFFFYLLVLRASIFGILPFTIQPTDLRILSAIVLTLLIAVRSAKREQAEEVLPI